MVVKHPPGVDRDHLVPILIDLGRLDGSGQFVGSTDSDADRRALFHVFADCFHGVLFFGVFGFIVSDANDVSRLKILE